MLELLWRRVAVAQNRGSLDLLGSYCSIQVREDRSLDLNKDGEDKRG